MSGRWNSWTFEVGSQQHFPNGSTYFNFSRGGFQGSRGSNTGDVVFIENVEEELDAPGVALVLSSLDRPLSPDQHNLPTCFVSAQVSFGTTKLLKFSTSGIMPASGRRRHRTNHSS